MKPVIIFRHAANEGPGYIESFLLSRKIPYSIVKIDQGDDVATQISSCSGLIFMGGPMSVNDDLQWIPGSLALIREAMAVSLPIMGVCLGGQLIARAMGATISQNPEPEFGWLPVQTITSSANNPWLKDIPASFDAFHWHSETFSLPAGAEHIMTSDACQNQGFVLGNAIAMQCHVEMTADLVRDWAVNNEDLPPPATSVQTRAAMVVDLQDKVRALQLVADKLFDHWASKLN
jgi:GMP synthase-like glutamine amidotransferase